MFGKIDLNVKFPPPFTNRMWNYKNADVKSIRRILSSVEWNNQLEFLSNCISSVFSNFCPNKVIKCCHRDAPWMTNVIKQRLKEKTKIYKMYVINKYDLGYKKLLNKCKRETCDLISSARVLLQE